MALIVFVQENYVVNYPVECLSAHLKKAGHEVKLAIGKPKEVVK